MKFQIGEGGRVWSVRIQEVQYVRYFWTCAGNWIFALPFSIFPPVLSPPLAFLHGRSSAFAHVISGMCLGAEDRYSELEVFITQKRNKKGLDGASRE